MVHGGLRVVLLICRDQSSRMRRLWLLVLLRCDIVMRRWVLLTLGHPLAELVDEAAIAHIFCGSFRGTSGAATVVMMLLVVMSFLLLPSL